MFMMEIRQSVCDHNNVTTDVTLPLVIYATFSVILVFIQISISIMNKMVLYY